MKLAPLLESRIISLVLPHGVGVFGDYCLGRLICGKIGPFRPGIDSLDVCSSTCARYECIPSFLMHVRLSKHPVTRRQAGTHGVLATWRCCVGMPCPLFPCGSSACGYCARGMRSGDGSRIWICLDAWQWPQACTVATVWNVKQ